MKIRPALDKVKEAIFNILGDIKGLAVLDLYAGTGSVGIEALSRGAGRATFVDSAREAINLVEKNLERVKLSRKGSAQKLKLPLELSRLRTGGRPYDLIFVDPPYDEKLVNPTLRRIVREKLVVPLGRVVVEHSPRERILEDVGLTILDQRKYGQTLISFLRFESQ
jgi:16S rRNA (guanine(966)-N(2))-methyltransferase RsmD